MLKAYPRTKFIGHANAFWANISADYADRTAYPEGPIVPGGITDKLLSDYPNMFADLSANSGHNALSRMPPSPWTFSSATRTSCISAATAIARTGAAAARRRTAPGVAPRQSAANAWRAKRWRCWRRSATPEIFRKIAWTNAHRADRAAGLD